jgi:hypothetical protein
VYVAHGRARRRGGCPGGVSRCWAQAPPLAAPLSGALRRAFLCMFCSPPRLPRAPCTGALTAAPRGLVGMAAASSMSMLCCVPRRHPAPARPVRARPPAFVPGSPRSYLRVSRLDSLASGAGLAVPCLCFALQGAGSLLFELGRRTSRQGGTGLCHAHGLVPNQLSRSLDPDRHNTIMTSV